MDGETIGLIVVICILLALVGLFLYYAPIWAIIGAALYIFWNGV